VGATAIPYVEYSFSPWHGCAPVSEGCAHCFARAIDTRFYGGGAWGEGAPLREQSDEYWRQPLAWDARAATHGDRPAVLCATMCDPCDGRAEPLWRRRLEATIAATPHLLWLLLTKRPQSYDLFSEVARTFDNVRLGATCENQARADERIPLLLSHVARGHWISVEPMLTPVTIAGYADRLDLVVCGDEDGPGRRPAALDWVRRLRDECRGQTKFFFKQFHFDNGPKTNCPELDGERWVEVIDD